MGLFSRHRFVSSHEQVQGGEEEQDNTDEILVFIRASRADIAASRSPRWSIAVASQDPVMKSAGMTDETKQDVHLNERNEVQKHRQQQRKSLLSFHSRHSSTKSEDTYSKSESFLSPTTHGTTTATSNNGEQRTLHFPSTYEFRLSSTTIDELSVIRHDSSSRTLDIDSHDESRNASSESSAAASTLLFQILLPRPVNLPSHSSSSTPATATTLHDQVEQVLKQHCSDLKASNLEPEKLPSSSSSLSPSSSSSSVWVESALVALQRHNLLASSSGPSGGFEVGRFMSYARNSWTGFVTEKVAVVLPKDKTHHNQDHHLDHQDHHQGTNGTADGDSDSKIARYTKWVDYAAHVAENNRLKALLGGGDANSGRGNGTSRVVLPAAGDTMSSSPHIHGGFGGGWWVSRPHDYARREREEERGRDRDPYGGLM